ncbi:MAG: signal peptide peptidase SppA [Luteolibacter sp.]
MKYLLICFPALLISALPLAAAEEKVKQAIIAVYDLEGPVSESGKSGQELMDLSLKGSRPLTMLELTQSLGQAVSDEAVKAVVIDADGAEADFSQVQEIRTQLLALRDAGKDVWIYSEHLSNRTALLGSAANHFTLMPEADCDFHGIRSESMYFKGMLDKIGVRADVIHIGDFKSFGENFYRTGPSDYALKQEETLIDSIYDQIIQLVAGGRKLKQEEVRALIDDGSLTPRRVVEAKLADHLMYRTDFVKKLRETYGEDAVFDRSYELPDLNGPEINGLMDFFKLMFSGSDHGRFRNDFVAVVALEGDITDESIAPVRSQILKLAKEGKAKALVLRVNSPGGSALASEVLWEATDEWKATGKPFVVSMGGVAASGGYYVSSGANRIFAEAGTITGSIGVVGMKFVVGEAMEKIGITTHTIQRGKNAGVMSMMRGFTDDEAKVMRDSMTAVYSTFKKRVTDGRGKALKGDLESLAGGRVYSGKDALEIGLVDEIGGLHQAIAYAAREAKMEKPEVKLLPEPKSGLEGLFAPPAKEDDDEIIHASVKPDASVRLQAMIKGSGVLDALPAPAQANVKRLASRIEEFQKCQVLLLGPDVDLR